MISLITKVFSRDLSQLLRQNISNVIVRALENKQVPWQKPWQGSGKGVGFPREVRSKKKFFGINFLLLQMAAKEHNFKSSWWGTSEQFAILGSEVKNRPANVTPGHWGTEIISYKQDFGKVQTVSEVVYNVDQLEIPYNPDYKFTPCYDLAEKVIHATDADIRPNDTGEAWYFYPPHDYITLPARRRFEAGIGGLPGYYESLAHELMHWTEPRLGFDVDCNEAIREMRAEIGASMLMEELGVPHSISFSNYNKWHSQWIKMLKYDYNLIFTVSASAAKAVDYIKKFSLRAETSYNQIDESVA